MSVLVLQTGPARVELLPAVGGSVGRFTWHDHDVLRPAPTGTTEVLDTGNFALVPFCNRIRSGRFRFGGHDVALPRNLGDHPHALHGQAWRRAWSVVSASKTHAVLAFEHTPDEWPWAYRAEQHFILDPKSLRQALSVTNTGPEPMPVGLGFHPYFPVRENERLKADVSGVWMIDGDCLPTTHVEGAWRSDWAAGARTTSSELIDNCYTGWNGVATLTAPAGPHKVLTASPECRWLHVYLPPGSDIICVEPVSNRPDPFNGVDSGIKILAPGETAAVWMEIAVS